MVLQGGPRASFRKGGGGASTFLALTDTPGSYSGQGTLAVRVNAAENALEFFAIAGTGDVVGPASATDNAVVRFNGAGGKSIQNSGVIVDDSNNVTGVVALTASGLFTVTLAGNTIDAQNTSDAASNQVGQFSGGNRATPADNDEAYFSFRLDNDAGTQTEFVRFTWKALDVSDASKDSRPEFQYYTANTLRELSFPAITADDVVVVAALAQTLTNKTLTTPTIGDFSNAGHDHSNAAGGGTIVDNYLLNTGDVGTGVYDFGGADSFELPNSAGGGTIDAAGEAGIDTTPDYGSLNFHDGTAERTLSPLISKAFIIKNPTASDDIQILAEDSAITLRKVRYLCIGGTNWVGQLQEGDANGGSGVDTQAADTTASAGTTATVTSFSNAAIDAGDWIILKTTSVSGSPTRIHVTFYYTIDP